MAFRYREALNQGLIFKALDNVNTKKISLICSLSLNIYNYITEHRYTDVSLMVAFEKKDYDVIKSIIHMIRDRNVLDQYMLPYFKTSFFDFTRNIELDIIKLMIDYRSDALLDDIPEIIDTYLTNNICIFKYIAETKVMLRNKMEILQVCCQKQRNDIFELIYNRPYDRIWDDDNEKLLRLASDHDNYKIVKFLIQQEVVPTEYMFTEACRRGRLIIVKMLLDGNFYSDDIKTTGLHRALQNRNYNMISLLLERKVEIPQRTGTFGGTEIDDKIQSLLDKYRN